MNKQAIALAADSAVTIGNHTAIHNSANKVFIFAEKSPVGAVIYANAEFMDVPIEIIIKSYAAKDSGKDFNSIKDYQIDFINYLESNNDLYRFSINEKRYVTNVYHNFLKGLQIGYESRIKEQVDVLKRKLKKKELALIRDDAFLESINYIANLESNNSSFEKYITKNYLKDIINTLSQQFQWLTKKQIKTMSKEICKIYDKKFYRNGYVGLLIAGYGATNIFPQSIHLKLGGVINKKVRYDIISEGSIDENNDATIIPLAQRNVMDTFIFGVDFELMNKMESIVKNDIKKTIKNMNNSVFAPGQKHQITNVLNQSITDAMNEVTEFAKKEYMIPIISSVSTLPVEELTSFAESMINITSVRRSVALDDNIGTVGGPIDVAVITKADGFIWLKKKQYCSLKENK